jgi:glycosyltransferase involved in cell wall biosynthesis
MLVSIIIPLYNKENSIYNTLQSVLNQTYKYIEVIVVDDGSTDKSAEIVLSMCDDRIKYHRKTNGGVSSARNHGIELAKGDWIMFLDADDSLYENALNELIKISNNFLASEICCGNYIVNFGTKQERGVKLEFLLPYINNPYKMQWLNIWNMRLGSFIVKNDILKNIKFRLNVAMGEDVLFVNSLMEYRIYFVNELIMSYNKEYSNLSLKRIPFYKCYSWNNTILHKNIYKVFTNSYDLGVSLLIYLKAYKFIDFFFLLAKKCIYIPIVIVVFVLKFNRKIVVNKKNLL